jgi:hypothetical protein
MYTVITTIINIQNGSNTLKTSHVTFPSNPFCSLPTSDNHSSECHHMDGLTWMEAFRLGFFHLE